MKKLFLASIILLSLLFQVNAQQYATTGSNTFTGVQTFNGSIKGNAGGGELLKIQTSYGYIDIGSRNTTYQFLETDRPIFYFNKPIHINTGTLSSHSTSNLYLQTGGANRITILNSNGNVGIETTDPQTKFQVGTSLGLSVSAANIDPTQNYDLTFLKNTGRLLLGWNRSGSKGEQNFISNRAGGSLGGFAFYDYDNAGKMTLLMTLIPSPTVMLEVPGTIKANALSGTTNLSLQTNGTDRVTILNSNGNVGIGITNPTNKLEVNGTIRTKEVIVENTNWPDYVFSPDYQLPSLESVSKHIQENKHLPNIPSAAEVAEQGVSLSEISTKLLQKIEELTLYTIQQQEMIDVLKEKIEKLETKK